MARIHDSDIKGKFLVYKSDRDLRTMEIDRETDGAFWEGAWINVQKHKPHRICKHNKEAVLYSRACQDRIEKIKDEEEYKRLNDIKTKALLALNAHKKERVRDIIENTMEDCPEYFI